MTKGFGRSADLNPPYNPKPPKVMEGPSTDKEGPFPQTTGVQGDYTRGSVRSGAPEAGSKLPKGRGYGAAKRG
jgi:hypothetical protein